LEKTKKNKKKNKTMSVISTGNEIDAGRAPRRDAGAAGIRPPDDDGRKRPKPEEQEEQKRPLKADRALSLPLKPFAIKTVLAAQQSVRAAPNGAYTETPADEPGPADAWGAGAGRALERSVELRRLAVESWNKHARLVERLVDLLFSSSLSASQFEDIRAALDELAVIRREGQNEAARQAQANAYNRVSFLFSAEKKFFFFFFFRELFRHREKKRFFSFFFSNLSKR
jgi:hypothetical protein